MDEPNAFMSGRTTLETNIMDDVNKEKFFHTITCTIVNKKSDGNKNSFIKVQKKVDNHRPKTLIKYSLKGNSLEARPNYYRQVKCT